MYMDFSHFFKIQRDFYKFLREKKKEKITKKSREKKQTKFEKLKRIYF